MIFTKLEQWLDFLIDFHFQESGSGLILPLQQNYLSSKEVEHIVVSYNEDSTDEAHLSRHSSKKSLDEVMQEEEIFQNQMAAALESYREQKNRKTRLSSTEPNSPSSKHKVSTIAYNAMLHGKYLFNYMHILYSILFTTRALQAMKAYQNACFFQPFNYFPDWM